MPRRFFQMSQLDRSFQCRGKISIMFPLDSIIPLFLVPCAIRFKKTSYFIVYLLCLIKTLAGLGDN